MSKKLTDKRIFYVATGYIGFRLTRRVITIPANVTFQLVYAFMYFKRMLPTFKLHYIEMIDAQSYYEVNCD